MENSNDFYVQVIELDEDSKNKTTENNGIVKKSNETSALLDLMFHKYRADKIKPVNSDDYFDKITEKVSQLSEKIKTKFDKIAEGLKPSEIEMQVSFGVTAKGNLIIISGKLEGSFSIKLRWKLK